VRIDALALVDFRNYVREQIEFAPGLNVVVGTNAQGKTNLLEAAYCVSGLGSPRGAEANLVRVGAERAVLHAKVARGARTARVDLEFRSGGGTRARVNGSPLASAKTLGELSVSVFFGPDELSLVKGSPDGRRRFLDDLAVKLRPARSVLRREWDRVLKQRNALLKSVPRGGARESSLRTLDAWDESFCRAGAALAAARLAALGELLPFATERFRELGGGARLGFEYVSTWLDHSVGREVLFERRTVEEQTLREILAQKLGEGRDRELERGVSLVGPHRDDVSVRLSSKPEPEPLLDSRTHASQGEQRTCALALKLGERDLLASRLGEEPVLLLDDVLSELDPDRRGWLANTVGKTGQTLLSSAETAATEIAGAELIVEVAEGRLRTHAG
jgi:DNA replication and repair protein RecF